MGTAGRSAPLRRTGSLLGLLGLEVAAVAVQGVPGRVGDHLGGPRRPGRPWGPEAVHLEVDQFRQLSGQVFDMYSGTAVHIWGILATEQGHAHGTLLPIQRKPDASVR